MLYNDSETQVMADNVLKIKIILSDHDTDEKKEKIQKLMSNMEKSKANLSNSNSQCKVAPSCSDLLVQLTSK